MDEFDTLFEAEAMIVCYMMTDEAGDHGPEAGDENGTINNRGIELGGAGLSVTKSDSSKAR